MNAPTRRTVIGATAALAALAVPATTQGAAGDDTELLAACANLHAVDAARGQTGLSDEEGDDLAFAWSAALRRVDGIPAHTAEGMRAKAKASFAALMQKVNALVGQTWRQQASGAEALALDTLAELSGAAFSVTPALLPRASTIDDPDAKLIEAAQAFVAAETVCCATCWATDDLDNREGDRAAELARRRAAEAEQHNAAKILVEETATTLAGYQSKTKAAIAWFGNVPPDDGVGDEILWSLALDLAGEGDAA